MSATLQQFDRFQTLNTSLPRAQSGREAEPNEILRRIGRNVSDAVPLVSVVIPAYNTAAFIHETLESVFRQGFRSYEVIVVNDGSPDTEELERVLENRLEDITYIKQPNAGAGAARNTAIMAARGEIIAFLDGDDVWLPDYLESQIAFLKGESLDMVYCDAILFGLLFNNGKTYMQTAPSAGPADFAGILASRCNVITSGTLARKQSIVDAGMFDPGRIPGEDFLVWLRMAKNGARFGYQRKQLLKYRVRPDSSCGDSVTRAERAIEVYERVRQTLELTGRERDIVRRRLARLKADLAVEQGKAFLLQGEFGHAANAFRVANRRRASLKLIAVSLLSRFAPRTLVRHYVARRPFEIPFVRKGKIVLTVYSNQ